MTKTVGFIGLGAMGQGMTRNLLAAGFAVQGYDVDAAAVARAAEAGASPARSPAAAAVGADLLAVCVFDRAQAEAVLFGDAGAVERLSPEATVLMHTTMAPAEMQRLEERLAETGQQMVDAPVTGGKVGADAGSLTIIASGSASALAAARPAFEAMGRRIYETGERVGAASSVKMINQLLVGVQVVAAAEAIALAAKAGADPEVVYDVITHGGGNSVSFKTRVPYILADDFAPRGVVDIFTKDLGIVTGVAAELGFPVPLAQTALARFQAAASAGLGRADDSAVVKVYEREGAVEVRAALRRRPHDADDSDGGEQR